MACLLSDRPAVIPCPACTVAGPALGSNSRYSRAPVRRTAYTLELACIQSAYSVKILRILVSGKAEFANSVSRAVRMYVVERAWLVSVPL